MQAGQRLQMLHRSGAIAGERQQVGQPFPYAREAGVEPARLRQDLDRAAVVSDRLSGRIHRVRRIAGRDQRARGGSGVGHRAGVVQMMRDVRGINAGTRLDPPHDLGNACVQPLAFERRQRRDQRLADQLVGESPAAFVAP